VKYLLDSNVWIAILNNSSPSVVKQFHAHKGADLYFCDVVKAELIFGAFKSQKQESNFAKLKAMFSSFSTLAFDEHVAWEFGDIRHKLTTQGQVIGPYDMQIAAIARAHQMTLVTANTREFMRVENLTIEDWSNPIINQY
jgi:tRNA(fMet)-specific endonuclease VapC